MFKNVYTTTVIMNFYEFQHALFGADLMKMLMMLCLYSYEKCVYVGMKSVNDYDWAIVQKFMFRATIKMLIYC